MKILAISLKNLASFAGEVTVDFRTAPLSHAGVFAIIGPTGAGKSTLLDALCLALYGKTPRTSVGNKDTALEGDGDKPWYLRDARHLIRRGVDEARASVRFESDGREYEATWSCKRRPRARTLEDPKVSLTSEGTVLADKITDLVDQVFTLTGLDFESFCRSVLLPQGQFERFLACNSDERSKLLEALTDPAGLYRGVSALAQERHAASQKRTDEARADVQRILVLNDEERDALEARIASHDDDARRTTEALTRAKEARQRHALIENAAMRAAELRSEAARKAADRDDAEPTRRTVQEALDARPLRDSAQLRDATAEVAQRLTQELALHDAELARAADDEQSATSEHASCTELHTSALQARAALQPALDHARRLDDALRRLSTELATERERLAALDADARALAARGAVLADQESALHEAEAAHAAWHAAHPKASVLAGGRVVWEPALADLARAHTALGDARSELDAAMQNATRLQAESERVDAARAEAEQSARTAQARAEAAAQHAEALRAADPRSRRDATNERRTRVESLRERLAARASEQGRRDARRAEAAQARADHARRSNERVIHAAELARLDAALEEAARAATIVDLQAHRAALVAGTPCVLCGSTEHPWADPNALPARDLGERRQFEASRDTARETLLDCEAELARIAERARWAAADADQLEAELETRSQELAATCVTLGLSAALDEPAHANEIAALHAALIAERAALDAAVKAADDADDAERSTARDAALAADAWRAAEQQASTSAQQLTRARADVERCEARVAEWSARSTESLNRAIDAVAAIPGAAASLRADPQACRSEWTRLADAYAAKQTERARLDDERLSVNEARTALQTQREVHAARRTPVEARCAELEAGHVTLSEERATVLDGRASEAVEQEAQAELTRTSTALERATSRLDLARRTASELRARRQEKLVHLEARKDEATAAAADHAAKLASLGLDEAEAVRRLALGDAELASMQAKLAALDEQANRAEERRKEAEEALRQAEAARPDEPADALDATISRLTDEHAQIQQAIGRDRAARENDDAQRTLRDEKQRALDALLGADKVWVELHDLIGSGGGKKFAQFAQSLAFDSLLASANEQLARLHPRYALRRLEDAAPAPAGGKPKFNSLLDMVIEDRELADAIRPVSTLSGGERFLVSLALALGLSTLASQRRKLASMFIDEGFGTLDPETLSTALGVLDALQARGTRVGVISHVSELKERLQARVVVERLGDGTSTLRVEG